MAHDFLHPLTGSFAMPAAENPTVVMIEAAYRQLGLAWRYLNCEVHPDRLGDAVRGARAMGWRGFNCSIPHKVAVIEHLDGLGESARIIGAVNTVVRRDDALIGENTDGKGFVKALRDVVDPAGKSVVVFGAGGAARAVCVELALAGAARLLVVNRGRERGEALVDLLNRHARGSDFSLTPASAERQRRGQAEARPLSFTADYSPWPAAFRIPEGTDIVINATSIGLYPDVEATLDFDVDTLHAGIVVADGIHNPPLTRLLRAARARGCRTADGLGMLVNQGVIGIRYWTGLDADAGVMRRALEKLGL
jgi:shikimate dehydrogenase